MPGFISFKPTMAQAILDDRKWQTRRLIKPQPSGGSPSLRKQKTRYKQERVFCAN